MQITEQINKFCFEPYHKILEKSDNKSNIILKAEDQNKHILSKLHSKLSDFENFMKLVKTIIQI